MNAKQIVRTALTALTANKLRSSLTILGVVIGVAAVISLMALGQGTQVTIAQSIESLGTNLLFVSPGASSESGFRGAMGSATTLTVDDAEALTAAPSVLAVAPQVSANVQVVAQGSNARAQVMGVTPEYESVRNLTVAEGAFIADSDVNKKTMVVVLGSSIAEQLFGDSDPVGQTVKLNGSQYRVLGVLESKAARGSPARTIRSSPPLPRCSIESPRSGPHRGSSASPASACRR